MKNEFLLPIMDRKIIARDTAQIWFNTSVTAYNFTAGQHADFTLIEQQSIEWKKDEKGNTRTFSIISAPGKDHISIATRLTESAFKKNIMELPIGTKVKLSKPMGNYVLHQDISKPAVFLIGGIGITPVLSMIESATERKLANKIFLFYSNKNLASTAFLSELEKSVNLNQNFKLVPTLTNQKHPSWLYETGKISPKMIKKYLPEEEISNSIYYLSGPPDMVLAMQTILTDQLKVSLDNIKTEEFAGY